MRSKYIILEALFIIVIIATTALVSAGVAYKWKFGNSGKVILTAEVYIEAGTEYGDYVKWEAGVYDWNEDDGVEYVKEYYRFELLPSSDEWWVNIKEGWLPRNGYAYGKVHYKYEDYYHVGYVAKARTYMEGYTKAYDYEGSLTVTTTP